MHSLVDIIIPLYNVERFFEKCLNSIINQTYHETEIIMTDDGSPDESGILADELAMSDGRAITIHQQNRWLGGARNSALKIAGGEYILFVDSDDYLRLDACEKLMQVVKKNDVDMVLFDIQHVDSEYHEGLISSPPIEPNRCIVGEEARDILFDLIVSSHKINNAWMKLYKSSLIQQNKLFFDESIRYAEDYEFCLRLFPCVQSMIHVTQPIYYYVFNDKSIMHSADPLIVDKFILLYKHREVFMKRYGWDTEEYLKKSAILLLTMIAKCLPKYLGQVGLGNARKYIKALYRKRELYAAMKRISLSDLPLGGVGKLAIWGIMHKQTLLIMIAAKRLEKSEGVYR